MTEAAGFVAWLGAAIIVLSDGRRALALGLALVAAGFTVIAWGAGERLGAAALLLGGVVAVVQRVRKGRDGWDVMPPGSTPRLVLSIVAGLLALWVAASVTTGAGAPLRFASLAVTSLMAARLLTERDPEAVLTAVAGLALAVAMASGIATTAPGPAPYLAAGLIAAGASLVRMREST